MWLIVILIVLGAALLWFIRPRDEDLEPSAPPPPTEDVDYAELERAEREVKEAAGPDEVRDWGPGTPQPDPTGEAIGEEGEEDPPRG